MLPPSEDALEQALSILLQSLERENGLDTTSLLAPEADIEHLARASKAIDISVSSLQKKASSHVVRLHRQRNSMASISQLPIELLEEILAQNVLLESMVRFKRLKQLASVCSHWLHVVRATPALWSVISSYDTHYLTALQKSKGSSLIDVHFEGTTGNPALFLSHILPARPRIGWLTLDTDRPQHLRTFFEADNSEMPKLLDLEVSYNFRHADAPFTLIPLPKAPSLRSLRTSSIAPLGWTAFNSFPLLERLEMRRLTVPSVDVFSILAYGCPLLKELSLWDVRDALSVEQESAINLPNLRSLFLGVCNDSVTLRLLRSLQVALLSNFVMESRTEAPSAILEALSRNDGQAPLRVATRLSTSEALDITIGAWQLFICGRNAAPGQAVNITTFWGGDNGPNFALLSAFSYSEAPAVHMDIQENIVFVNEESRAMFQHLPTLDTLKFRAVPFIPILELLSKPHDQGGSEEEAWPCPRLKLVTAPQLGPTMNNHATKEVVIKLLKARLRGNVSSLRYGESARGRFLDADTGDWTGSRS